MDECDDYEECESGTYEVIPAEEVQIPQTNDKKTTKDNKTPEKHRLYRLPLARVKHIMKLDPDCNIISQDATILMTKATEMFIEILGKESAKVTNQTKRKTIMKRDLETVISAAANLCFLDGMLEEFK